MENSGDFRQIGHVHLYLFVKSRYEVLVEDVEVTDGDGGEVLFVNIGDVDAGDGGVVVEVGHLAVNHGDQ